MARAHQAEPLSRDGQVEPVPHPDAVGVVAGVAFSVSLLIIQLGSSQYSPRVVHTLFRDPFNKRVMGVVVGTFTYSLIVLRSVRSPFEEGGEPVIPNLSVTLAVVLGVVAILSVVAFIDHSAHSMDISEVLQRVVRESNDSADGAWTTSDTMEEAAPRAVANDTTSEIVRFDRDGWVQQIDVDEVVACADPGGTVVLHTAPGRYAVQGTPICTIRPAPSDRDAAIVRARAAIGLGNTRTMQQDPSYGLRQLVDVALRALSPGVNDPTTAQDAILHSASVLADLLDRPPLPSALRGLDGRQLQLEEQLTHDDLVRLAFEEVRRAAATQPTVCVCLLESMGLLHESLTAAGKPDRAVLIARQARLVVTGAQRSGDLLETDIAMVEQACERRFGTR